MIINFILHSIYKMSLFIISVHIELLEETGRKSIDKQSKNIWSGCTASLIVSKKNNLKNNFITISKKKIFSNLPSKNHWLQFSKCSQYQYWENIYLVCTTFYFQSFSCMGLDFQMSVCNVSVCLIKI